MWPSAAMKDSLETTCKDQITAGLLRYETNKSALPHGSANF